MKRLIIVLGGLAVLVYAASAGMQWLTPRVEEDLSNRVNVSLAEQGLLWADVSVDGRNVTLSGVAPTTESRDKALNAAARVFGVAKVTDGLLLAEDASATKVATKSLKKDYTVSLIKHGDDISLEGKVPDQRSLDVLNRLAVTHYGAEHVSNSLVIDAVGAPAGWSSAAGTVLFNITNLEEAEVTLSGSEIMISGTVLDKQFADQIEKQLDHTLPDNYKLGLAVDVVTPTVTVTETEEPSTEQPIAKTEEKAKVEEKMTDVKPLETAKAKVEEVSETNEPSESSILARVESFMNGARDKAMAAVEPAAGDDEKGDCNAQELALHKVYFDFNKADVKDVYKPTLAKVAAEVPACDAVEVSGYTDSTGSALYNQWLSEQRAEAGVRALIRAGAPASKLVAKGYGENDPATANTSKKNRSQNRRVEFKPTDAKNVVSTAAQPKEEAKVEKKAKKVEAKADVKATDKVANPATVPSLTIATSGSVVEVVNSDAPWWERFKAPVSASTVTKTAE